VAASIVENTIFHYRDQGKYLVHRYVVMPDHLHIILTPGDSTSLEKAVQLIKGASSHEIGKGKPTHFPVWQQGFTEHQIRDATDFVSHVQYINENPVKARPAETPEDYPHGSASGKFKLDPWPVASGAKARESTTLTAGLETPPFQVSKAGKA
jgi:putative transposase